MREQREIKFRAWYPDDDRMGYQDGKTPAWLGDILTNGYYIPMQYTGLKDRNGKEIYEGDVVTAWFPAMPHDLRAEQEIVFVDGCFGCGDYPLRVIDRITIEVIGNIYENPGLMAGEKE